MSVVHICLAQISAPLCELQKLEMACSDSDSKSNSAQSDDDGGASIFAPPSSCPKQRTTQAAASKDVPMVAESSEESGVEGKRKKANKSGASKKKMKKQRQEMLKLKQQPSSEDRSGDDDNDYELPEVNFKVKHCGLCCCKNCDADPVDLLRIRRAKKLKKRGLGGAWVKLINFMRWEKPNGAGGSCYYCFRVYELRHPHRTRPGMKEWFNEPKAEDAQSSNKELFMIARERAIELLSTGERMPQSFCSEDIQPATQKAEQKRVKFERAKRKGKNFRMDQFLKSFPDQDPKNRQRVPEARQCWQNMAMSEGARPRVGH